MFHNGRVKILDTLAKEVVSSITGKSKYFDYIVADGREGSSEAVRPAVHDVRCDRRSRVLPLALIGVDFLPLRESLSEAGFHIR